MLVHYQVALLSSSIEIMLRKAEKRVDCWFLPPVISFQLPALLISVLVPSLLRFSLQPILRNPRLMHNSAGNCFLPKFHFLQWMGGTVDSPSSYRLGLQKRRSCSIKHLVCWQFLSVLQQTYFQAADFTVMLSTSYRSTTSKFIGTIAMLFGFSSPSQMGQ